MTGIDDSDEIIERLYVAEREHDAALAEVRTLREALTAIVGPGHQLLLSIIAVEHHLRKPYPDDPRWTPWSRFIEPHLSDLGVAVSSARRILADTEEAKSDG